MGILKERKIKNHQFKKLTQQCRYTIHYMILLYRHVQQSEQPHIFFSKNITQNLCVCAIIGMNHNCGSNHIFHSINTFLMSNNYNDFHEIIKKNFPYIVNTDYYHAEISFLTIVVVMFFGKNLIRRPLNSLKHE